MWASGGPGGPAPIRARGHYLTCAPSQRRPLGNGPYGSSYSPSRSIVPLDCWARYCKFGLLALLKLLR